jgi:SPP1 gp7 family putative phage head morphogenesis protein
MALIYDNLFKQGETAADKLIVDTEKRLVTEYKASLKELRSQLAEMYAKYAQGDTLTYAEMSKYNRLNALFDNINHEVKKLGQRGVNHLIKLGEDSYEASFYRSAYAIEAGGGAGNMVSIGWGQLSPEVIKASVMNELSGLNISERYKKRTEDQLFRIREQITQSLNMGESYPKMAARIKSELDADATRAMRVARTEGHRNTQAGRLECIDRAENKGVDLVRVWSASLDERTRDAHGALDGQEADAEGYFHSNGAKTKHPGGFGVSELDINCRCSIRSEIRGFAPKIRRVRGQGETEYKTYDQWKKAKDEEAKKKVKK